jgi:hypothetical protein
MQIVIDSAGRGTIVWLVLIVGYIGAFMGLLACAFLLGYWRGKAAVMATVNRVWRDSPENPWRDEDRAKAGLAPWRDGKRV